MDSHHPEPRPDAASTDDAVAPATPFAGSERADAALRRAGYLGHIPDAIERAVPADPETAFTETRRLRHDGWTPDKKRGFIERLAEDGIVIAACHAVGMSARAAYKLRDRDALFAAGWEAATVMARGRLADEVYSRALNGVVERIYRDGAVIAERHRYDNRLTMSALTRLDARIDRAEERGAPVLGVVARWDEYLDALGDDRRDDGLGILTPAPPAEPAETARDRELRELHPDPEDAMDEFRMVDRHLVWEQKGRWWTDYPPPAGFDGEQEGAYGDSGYRRALSPDELAAVEASAAVDLAEAEAQRANHFAAIVDSAMERAMALAEDEAEDTDATDAPPDADGHDPANEPDEPKPQEAGDEAQPAPSPPAPSNHRHPGESRDPGSTAPVSPGCSSPRAESRGRDDDAIEQLEKSADRAGLVPAHARAENVGPSDAPAPEHEMGAGAATGPHFVGASVQLGSVAGPSLASHPGAPSAPVPGGSGR